MMVKFQASLCNVFEPELLLQVCNQLLCLSLCPAFVVPVAFSFAALVNAFGIEPFSIDSLQFIASSK